MLFDPSQSDCIESAMLFDQTNFVLLISFLLLFITSAVVSFVFKKKRFNKERWLNILYESVTQSTQGRLVTLEVGLDDFQKYLHRRLWFSVRSDIFLKDDPDYGRWLVILKGRHFPFYGKFLSLEVKRVEPKREPLKTFLFKLSIFEGEGEDELFWDLETAKTSKWVRKGGFNLNSCLKKDSPLNLRIRFEIFVVEDVRNVLTGFCKAIPKSDVLSQMHCVIKSSDRDFVCHKGKLSSTSYKFNHEMVDGVVDLRDVMDGDTASDLIQYIYHRKTPNLQKTCGPLMSVAERYGLSELKERCQRHLVSKLSVDTAAALYKLSLTHDGDFARKETVKFVAVFKNQVLESTGFWELEEGVGKRLMVEVRNLPEDEVSETERRYKRHFQENSRPWVKAVMIVSLSILFPLGLYCLDCRFHFATNVFSFLCKWFFEIFQQITVLEICRIMYRVIRAYMDPDIRHYVLSLFGYNINQRSSHLLDSPIYQAISLTLVYSFILYIYFNVRGSVLSLFGYLSTQMSGHLISSRISQAIMFTLVNFYIVDILLDILYTVSLFMHERKRKYYHSIASMIYQAISFSLLCLSILSIYPDLIECRLSLFGYPSTEGSCLNLSLIFFPAIMLEVLFLSILWVNRSYRQNVLFSLGYYSIQRSNHSLFTTSFQNLYKRIILYLKYLIVRKI